MKKLFFCFLNLFRKNPLTEVHEKLAKRYLALISEDFSHEKKMLETILANPKWPEDKKSRWLGFVSAIIINQKLTTVEKERDFSRNLFHEAYKKLGYEIPKTIEI